MDKDEEKLYRGRFQHLPDRQLNSIRLFVSSTFSDTTEERNGLIERVYPRLREYCSNKYQIQFHYSDMRWGIPSTAANSHSTVDMCLEELDTCSRLSLATNCVIFLSHRYGSRLAPASLSTELLQSLLKYGSLTADEREKISEMYQYDENYLDGKYFLRPINDEKQWTSEEKELQEILRKAADASYQQGKITEEERRNFHISVTAQEIYRTLKNNQERPRRIICFFRELIDIDQLDSKYRETENADHITSLLNQVKTELRQFVDAEDIYSYQVRWTDDDDRANYFSKFLDDFHTALVKQIDFHMQYHRLQLMNHLSNQILEHAIQCNLLLQRYFPRDDILDQVKDFIQSSTNGPCLLVGESGTGKSSIMAKLALEIPRWYSSSDSVSVIVRFLGATPSTSDVRRPILSIIEQLCQIYHWAMPSHIDRLKESLEEHLVNIPPYENLILLLDSVDQLQPSDIEDLSRWLPTNCSWVNVKIIFSTIGEIEMEQKTYRLEKQFEKIYGSSLTEIEINPFDRQMAEHVIHSWLKQDRRCLTPDQYQWLSNKFRSNLINPLFLSLLYDQTVTWHSYDETVDRKFHEIKRTSDAIGYLYYRLGQKHGEMLVRRSMRYIQISGGLNELELEDILSSDDEVLQSVFAHYLPPWKLFRLPSTLWIRIRNEMQKYLVEKQIDQVPCICFYHRTFQYYQPMDVKQIIILNQEKERMEKVRLEYFSNQHSQTFDMSYSPKLMKKYHLTETLISVDRCLTKQKPFRETNAHQYNLRRLHQLCLNLNRYDFAHPWTIFHYPFLNAYLKSTPEPMFSLLYEFSIGAHDPNGELRYLLKQFERSMSILNTYPENFAFEMIYRLFPLRNQLPHLTWNLLRQCLKHCPLVMLTDTERDACLVKYRCSKSHALDIDAHRLFLLNDDKEINLFSWYYYGLFRTGHLILDRSDAALRSFQCDYPYVCCQSTNGLWFVIECNTKRIVFEISADRVVCLMENNLLLSIAPSKDALEVWNWSSNLKISSYKFPNDPIVVCNFHSSTVKVQCESMDELYELTIDDQGRIELNRTMDAKAIGHTHWISLDHHREFHYSIERADATLVIRDETVTTYSIQFPSVYHRIFHLKQSCSIAWLTVEALFIFYPLDDPDLVQTFELTRADQTDSFDYNEIHDHHHSAEFENQYHFIACINQSQSILTIHQWFYDKEEKRFQHRLVTHVQFDHPIFNCVFNARWFDGVTLFCCDEQTLYKYNGTMCTFSNTTKFAMTLPILSDRWKIVAYEYLVHWSDKNELTLFSLKEDHMLENKSTHQSIVDYVIRTDSSDILLLNDHGQLMIYSLSSSMLRWTINHFEAKRIQLYSTPSSFYVLCRTTRSFYQLDSPSFQISLVLQLPFDSSLGCVCSKDLCYFLSSDQKTLLQCHLIKQTITTYDLNVKLIERVIPIAEHVLLYGKNHRLYLWRRDTTKIVSLEKTKSFICRDQRVVLECLTTKTLVLYDVQMKLRGVIHLEAEAIPSQSMCLSDHRMNHEQYLFVLGHDRLFRVYTVENGRQLIRLFIHSHLDSLLGIIKNQLIFRIENRLCMMKILDQMPEREQISPNHSILFERSMWMTCYDELCTWR